MTAENDALRAEVERHNWLYSVDLGGGLVTKGQFGRPNPHIMSAFDRSDFRGKKVLDVGCFDGHWSFEAERRGAATVFATDYLVGDPRAEWSDKGVKELPTFRLAHRILNSQVRYHADISVNDIARLGERDFDVVIFCGVYYHLKNPLLAFSRLRGVMKEGATIIVEGPVIEGPQTAFARFFYKEAFFNDSSNWWVPTVPCLLQWVECSYFEMLSMSGPHDRGQRETTLFARDDRGVSTAVPGKPGTEQLARYTLTARAVRRADYNYVLPDEDLAPFDSRP
jgi:tRNA (mo5U34)-methyltransferase